MLLGDDTVEIIQLKKKMENEFEIKDLGNLKILTWAGGSQFKRRCLCISRKYILDLVSEIGMMG